MTQELQELLIVLTKHLTEATEGVVTEVGTQPQGSSCLRPSAETSTQARLRVMTLGRTSEGAG